MLTEKESEYIFEVLVQQVRVQATPRQYMVVALLPELQAKLADGLSPELLVRQAVDLCISDAYRHTPPALVFLLNTLLEDLAGIPEIIERIKIPPAPSPDPF